MMIAYVVRYFDAEYDGQKSLEWFGSREAAEKRRLELEPQDRKLKWHRLGHLEAYVEKVVIPSNKQLICHKDMI